MKSKYSQVILSHAVCNPVLGCAFLILPFAAVAQPEIQSTDFDESSNTLRINGNGFGTPDLEFAFLDTIDKGSLSNNGNIKNYTYDNLWEQYGTEWAVPLVPREMPGPLAESENNLYFGGPGRSNNSYLRPVEEQNSRRLYVSWNYRPSLDPNKDGGSNKFIRIWDDHTGTHTRISWTQMHLTYGAKDISGSDDISWGGWSGNVGEWNLLEIYVDSGNNVIKAWTNGKLIHDVKNFIKSGISDGLGIRLLGFDPSIGDPYADMEIYIDNLYASNTQARVVLAAQATWSNALLSQTATQLPLNWSNSTIEVNIDPNKLTQESYIYVINEDREVNQTGYPVSGCSQCPAPPKLTID